MYRQTFKMLSALMIVAGIWLFLSPFLFDFGGNGAAFWNSLIAGAAITLFGAVREWADRDMNSWASWMNILLGIWLILAPFILAYADLALPLWNTVVVGMVIAGLGTLTVGQTPSSRVPRFRA